MNTFSSKPIISNLFILSLIILILSCYPAGKHDCVITNVNIVDVNSGKILSNKTVVIDSSRIVAIYDGEIAIPNSKIVINGNNKYLIPGLWDMHAHYNWGKADLDPLLIANGITGVREMWGAMPSIGGVPKESQTDSFSSPDIYTSGDIIDGNPPAYPACLIVANPEEAIEAVNRQIKYGVDFIKVYSNLTEECFIAIANEANKRNIPFAGHIPDKVSIYQAIEAGMASSEHLYGILYACSSEANISNTSVVKPVNEYLSTFSEQRFDSLCHVLSKSNMWLCPTLTVNKSLAYLNDTMFTNDNRIAYIPKYITEFWYLQIKDWFKDINVDSVAKSNQMRFQFLLSLTGKMNNNGVKLLAGTDFPNPYCIPGFSLHDELQLMVEGGMPPLDALRAATLNAAIFMNSEIDFGSIEVGKLASLVILNKNPLENIENTKSIETVILRGEVFNRKTLDLLLTQAKSKGK